MNNKIKICEQFIFDPNTNTTNLKNCLKKAKKLEKSKKKNSKKRIVKGKKIK